MPTTTISYLRLSQRLARRAALLAVVDARRASEGDASLCSGLEAQLLNEELRDVALATALDEIDKAVEACRRGLPAPKEAI